MKNYTDLMKQYEYTVSDYVTSSLDVHTIDEFLPAKKDGVKPLYRYMKALKTNKLNYNTFVNRTNKYTEFKNSNNINYNTELDAIRKLINETDDVEKLIPLYIKHSELVDLDEYGEPHQNFDIINVFKLIKR